MRGLTGFLNTVTDRHGALLLRLSIGIVYTWFGIQKFMPGISPATVIAELTMDEMTLGLIPSAVSMPLLALLETIVGIGILCGVYRRTILALLTIHLLGTFASLIMLPAMMWADPLLPTMTGQYVLKNLITLGAITVLWADNGRSGEKAGLVTPQ